MVDSSKDLVAQRRYLKVRWLAASTGLVSVSSLATTTLYTPLPVMLMGGAAVAGRWPRIGRWLMWTGASLLSIFVLPIYFRFLLHPEAGFFSWDTSIMLINFGWVGSVILLPLCDAMLLIDVFKRRQAQRQIA
jgi:hypothetical protein